jgi:hypothetical protein
MCDSQFPGSHFCHIAEYLRAASYKPIPVAGAWVDFSFAHGDWTTDGIPTAGRAAGDNWETPCENWSSATTTQPARKISAQGTVMPGLCSEIGPVACCQ